jgi:hypothetical protein
MPEGGIEPPCPYGRGILSPVRLPVPPLRRGRPLLYHIPEIPQIPANCFQRKVAKSAMSAKAEFGPRSSQIITDWMI